MRQERPTSNGTENSGISRKARTEIALALAGIAIIATIAIPSSEHDSRDKKDPSPIATVGPDIHPEPAPAPDYFERKLTPPPTPRADISS